jgi:hypothetical protein
MIRLMLDSHPNIANVGECDFLFDMVSDSGQYPPVFEYHKWLSENWIFESKQLKVDADLSYLDLMNSFIEQFQFRNNNQVLSMNVHRHFNRIPDVFPNARYIHLLRDPRDVARSCIGMGWAGHVYYGVDKWVESEKSWDLLKRHLKQDAYLEIKYEDLLSDIKGVLTTICSFLGLEYSDHMLDYAMTSSYDPPNINLSYQWKTKQSKRDLQLVEGKISNMLLKRGYQLSGYRAVKPGILERMSLMVRNKNYTVLYKINKYGVVLYLENLLANKIGLKSRYYACQQKINAIDIKGLK